MRTFLSTLRKQPLTRTCTVSHTQVLHTRRAHSGNSVVATAVPTTKSIEANLRPLLLYNDNSQNTCQSTVLRLQRYRPRNGK